MLFFWPLLQISTYFVRIILHEYLGGGFQFRSPKKRVQQRVRICFRSYLFNEVVRVSFMVIFSFFVDVERVCVNAFLFPRNLFLFLYLSLCILFVFSSLSRLPCKFDPFLERSCVFNMVCIVSFEGAKSKKIIKVKKIGQFILTDYF